MSRRLGRIDEKPFLQIIDENGSVKRASSELPVDIVKKTKIPALSTVEVNSVVEIEKKTNLQQQEELPPIESGELTKDTPYKPDNEDHFDVDKLLKESISLIGSDNLTLEPISNEPTSLCDNPIPMQMEPLSDSDFVL